MSGYNTLPELSAYDGKTDAEGKHSSEPKTPSAKQAERMTETDGKDIGQEV